MESSGEDDESQRLQQTKRIKRPRTAYAFYVQRNFRVMADQWNLHDGKEVLRRLSGMWRSLPEPLKQPYREMQREDRERYNKEKQKRGAQPKVRHRKREFDAPAKTRNAFITFEQLVWKEVRDKLPIALTQRDVVREIARRWRAMTPEQKKPYRDLANEDKKRYAKEKAAYIKRRAEMSSQQRADLLVQHYENERRERIQFDADRRYIYERPQPPVQANQGPADQLQAAQPGQQPNEVQPQVEEVEVVPLDQEPNNARGGG